MRIIPSRAIIYGLIVLMGLLSALPNLLPNHLTSALPDWYTENTVALGLDLQGGTHLLLQADLDALFAEKYQSLAKTLKQELRNRGIRYTAIASTEQGLSLRFADAHRSEAARNLIHELVQQAHIDKVSIDNTSDVEFSLALSQGRQVEITQQVLEQSVEVVRRRLNETGLVEPSITRQGKDSILLQMPGISNPAAVKQLLGTTAKMRFHWLANSASTRADSFEATDLTGAERYRLETDVALAGKHIVDARSQLSEQSRQPVVSFRLDNEGARIFAAMTAQNIGRALAIVLDDKVITAPVIRGVIAGGSGEISGNFSAKEASELALLLRAGALPTDLNVVEERTVGPDLGSESIQMGISTGLIGALLVLVSMLVLYGRWGVIACIGLAINMALLFGVLSLFGATLTLPGIAGLILTLGMAVDGNILINERIREESEQGATAGKAINHGFDRAFATILDSNVTTLIAVSLLFLFGSGPVQGFSVTIAIGLLTSMFTALAVTRLIMLWYLRGRARSRLQINGLVKLNRLGAHCFDILAARKWAVSVSLALSLLAMVLFFTPGLNYGVDFTGGTLIEVNAAELSTETLRQQLDTSALKISSIQAFDSPGQFMIRLADTGDSTQAADKAAEQLKRIISRLDPGAEYPRTDIVGPKVSNGFGDATILAILIAATGMLGYLWLRFESHFAQAATLTIALDLTKTIGFFAISGIEFNLTAVAALLALIGYSINDKVVIFDRIRENLRAYPDKPVYDIINLSIGNTLSRTLYTSATTFLALLPMGIYGGPAVSSFAIPMLFGVVVGTGSSILIASPILYYLCQRRIQKGAPVLRPQTNQLDDHLASLP